MSLHPFGRTIAVGTGQVEEMRIGTERPASKTLGNLIDEIASRYPDVEAVVAPPVRISFEQLRASTEELARGLMAMGVGKGDHVAILMGNRPEWLLSWFALNRIGAVAVGVSTWSTGPELNYILRHSDAKWLIASKGIREHSFVDTITGLIPQLVRSSPGSLFCSDFPYLRGVVMVDEPIHEGFIGLDSVLAAAETVPVDVVQKAQSEVMPTDIAILPYTSGSTGTPKGVQLVHRDMIENAFDIGEAEGFRPQDRFWLVLPLFWSAGNVNTSMVTMTHGGTLVLQEYFDAEKALELMSTEQCTHYFAFPNVTAALYENKARHRYPLRNARAAVSTGNPEGLRMLMELGFTELYQSYGTTEDYGFATITCLDDSLEDIKVCQGRPLPGMTISILDPDTGSELAPGQEGEICITGHVTVGYYKDEEQTRSVFDDSGRFHTGDLGFLDDLGRLHLLGRLRELIKTGGFNVAPVEVESVLLSHSGVAEAYVVGLPDEVRGQGVAAFVRRKRADLSEDELIEFCRHYLSSYKVPTVLRFWETFPMTATGKVSKSLIVEHAAAESEDGSSQRIVHSEASMTGQARQ